MIGITTGFRLSYSQATLRGFLLRVKQTEPNPRKGFPKESIMSNRGQVFLGLFLLFCGGTLFLNNVTQYNAHRDAFAVDRTFR
jgi:hypothetical protein